MLIGSVSAHVPRRQNLQQKAGKHEDQPHPCQCQEQSVPPFILGRVGKHEDRAVPTTLRPSPISNNALDRGIDRGFLFKSQSETPGKTVAHAVFRKLLVNTTQP